jgi:DNA invertase Pin-like site-specific DNA recombinase
MGNKRLRAAVYMRVSSDRQTVENQRRDLERMAAHRNWNVVETYTDQGISGSKGRDKRPAFDRMCKDAAHGKLDVVMVWAIDRLGRSLAGVATTLKEFQEQNVAVVIPQQNVDGTTSSGKAMLGMCAVFAEFERDILRDRINAGLARARAQGKKLGRPTSVTAKVERQILDRLAEGHGKLRIARDLGVGTSTVQRVAAKAATVSGAV